MGRCPAVQWLLLARRLLVAPLRLPPHTPGATTTEGAPASGAPQQQQGQDQGQGTASPASGPSPGWYWWSLRCVMAQQHALDGRSATLAGEAAALIARLLAWADACSSDNANDTTSSSSSNGASGGAGGQEGRRADAGLLGVLFVELALCQYAYGYVEAGRQYLARAGALLGVEPQLTGALGKRTVHQVDPKVRRCGNGEGKARGRYSTYTRWTPGGWRAQKGWRGQSTRVGGRGEDERKGRGGGGGGGGAGRCWR